jgi:carbon-monoxide dehydrogenase medium subunit
MMKLRLASPEFLVDINDLHELDYIREEGAELAIGALTRHVELLENERLATAFPMFRDAERVIADPVVRNRGTIGGSLCQADAARTSRRSAWQERLRSSSAERRASAAVR